jgi:uncharacterized protein YerC
MTLLTKRHGTEGSQHDPYSYEELIFKRKELKVVLHYGLAEWIEINDQRTLRDDYSENIPLKEINIYKKFEESTGLSTINFERVYDRINHPKKCKKCGSKKRAFMSGFPGETFEMCGKCEHIINTHFNESAIM